MSNSCLKTKIETFKALHAEGKLLLANAWDGMSARLALESGAKAIATTSAGVAWCLGTPDGHVAKRSMVMQNLRQVVASTSLPVSADIENGLLEEGESMVDLARELQQIGCVGVNLEDAADGKSLSVALGAERIAALRKAADSLDNKLFINARIDTWLLGESNQASALIERANAYFAAGADCAFIPGLIDLELIRQVASSINGPLNIMALPGAPSAAEFFAAGAKRVSAGSFFAEQAYALTKTGMSNFLASGTLQPQAEAKLGYMDLNGLIAKEV